MNNDMTNILSAIVAQAVAQAVAPLNDRIAQLEQAQRPVAQAQPTVDPMSALLTALVAQAQPTQAQSQRKPAQAKDLVISWKATKNTVEYTHENAKHYWTTSERKAVNAYIKSAGGSWKKNTDGTKGGKWEFNTAKAAQEFCKKAPTKVLAEEVKAQQEKAAEYYANKQ